MTHHVIRNCDELPHATALYLVNSKQINYIFFNIYILLYIKKNEKEQSQTPQPIIN